MIMLVLSYLGTAAGGTILKGLFGMWQESADRKHERELAMLRHGQEERKYAYENFKNADSWTKVTRRVLAWVLCGTYCIILLLWAIFPSVPVVTLVETASGEIQGGSGLIFFGYELLGYTSRPNLEDRTLVVTTGHLVFCSSYFLTFILSSYFVPVGKR